LLKTLAKTITVKYKSAKVIAPTPTIYQELTSALAINPLYNMVDGRRALVLSTINYRSQRHVAGIFPDWFLGVGTFPSFQFVIATGLHIAALQAQTHYCMFQTNEPVLEQDVD
jgi:hypothetical protein